MAQVYVDPIAMSEWKVQMETINKDCEIEFISIDDKEGNRAYVNGLLYLITYAGKKVFKNCTFYVQHSIDKGIYIKTSKCHSL